MSERITIRHPHPYEDFITINETKQLPDTEQSRKVLNRLCDLEDKIEQGKIVELPCAVGDMVYIPNSFDKKVHKYRVDEINIGAGNNNVVVLDLYIGDYILPRNIAIYFNQFGKTVFLTREEAKKALERSENGKY